MSTNEGNRILIIEDEKVIAQALEFKLSQADFVTRMAVNGEEALATLSTESFDLIILDLIMPKVDGFEVLKVMKERRLITPVIVLTNLSNDEDERRAREFGVCEFFVKTNMPIAEIVERVKKQLQRESLSA